MEGVVIQSYGAGNMPDLRKDLMKEFSLANKRGMILVNCSQCASGHVTDQYAAGRVSLLYSPLHSLIQYLVLYLTHRTCMT